MPEHVTVPETPDRTRPRDTWRVCNRTLDQGCNCDAYGPSRAVAIAAEKRLNGELEAAA